MSGWRQASPCRSPAATYRGALNQRSLSRARAAVLLHRRRGALSVVAGAQVVVAPAIGGGALDVAGALLLRLEQAGLRPGLDLDAPLVGGAGRVRGAVRAGWPVLVMAQRL